MKAEGIVRKISIGDLKNGITYKVGQEMGGGRMTITEIKLDVETTDEIGTTKYDITVMEHGSEYHRKWKSFIGMPVTVEYDIDEEQL